MKVVIIGCTHAGIAAVKQILKVYPKAEITVYERQANIAYLSCATYLHIEGTVQRLSDAVYAEPEEFTKQGVRMQLKHDVVQVDAAAHRLLVQNLVNKHLTTDHYDRLIMATGSITAIPAITGIENPKVMLCKTFDQAHDLCQNAESFDRVAVLGGGYVGIELAEGYVNSGHQVTLIQRPKSLLNAYVEPAISDAVAAVLRTHGVKVVLGTEVTAFENTDSGDLLVKTNSGDYQVDMAAISTGMLPQTDLLEGQVKMAANGAIITDDYMQTSDPDIFAAGDAAVSHDNPAHQLTYAPLVSHAIRQGALAGINVFDRRLRTIGTQKTTGMQVFDQTVVATGLTLAAAKAANLNAAQVVYQGAYRPEFMPATPMVTVHLIYDRNNRKILGAQLMSGHDVSQAANTVSALIQNGGTVDQLAFLDTLFSPNFNDLYNYLNLAGQLAVDQEQGYLRT
ncbi:FAD-dependent oxidoreductase [Lactiplantibacillus songbeiensis]|uniref:FAD-dependent oxidoreductase n=1 Tax=Lactiplantibacillus songbeiensis TaxID=2559920 RepID=A0ABW4C092_9LACO|nr:FAD-dependent oxidoreductase [Lactiplantibacillus songbeiensis]